MSLEDPRTYQRYEEKTEVAAERLAFAINVQRLQDEMRRLKQNVSLQTLADTISRTVKNHAPGYPVGAVSAQNIYDFLKLKNSSVPGPKRRLTFHAFMMVVDEAYREKWNYTYFVRRAGLAMVEFFSMATKMDASKLAANLEAGRGLYSYVFARLTGSEIGKQYLHRRYLLLTKPRDLPFLLAFDFDLVGPFTKYKRHLSERSSDAAHSQPQPSSSQFAWTGDGWDLDGRVGFYIPTQNGLRGILLLNSFKWDWPAVYRTWYSNRKDRYYGSTVDAIDIELTDINCFPYTDETVARDVYEKSLRSVMAEREPSNQESLKHLEGLLEQKFDWGADL